MLSSRPSGMSLIELLIVLACVAVLTQFALPSYTAWVQRGHRAQARVALLQAALWLERSAAANGAYPSANQVPPSVVQAVGLPYRLHVNSTAQGFVLRAVPEGAQAGDPCGVLTLTHTGVRSVENAAWSATACWQP